MNYKPPEHQPQVEETTPVEGRHLPQIATQRSTLEDTITHFLNICNDIKHQRIIKNIAEIYKRGFLVILHDINSKKPNWMGMTPITYNPTLQEILAEYVKKPDKYGYGIVVGEQRGRGFSLVAIDVDVDNDDCKEKIAREIETRLTNFKMGFFKETTKTNRLHYYVIIDCITPEIENITELPFPYPCFKWKNGAKLPGKIELFAKKNRYIIIYDGIINDKDPFAAQDFVIYDYLFFKDFLRNWLETFSPPEDEEPVKESVKEPIKEPPKESVKVSEINGKSLFSKIVEAYKIIRNHNIVNGWEIEKTFSAYCVRENIDMEQSIEGFKTIYASEYDEKRTIRLLNATKNKDLALLPHLYRVYNHVSQALNSNVRLSDNEKDILEALLVDLKLNGYSDYVLPSYLRNAENVYLYESTEQESKDHKPYYEESYFIELNGNIKEVVFVSIISFEYKGIYKPHKLKLKKHVGIKAEIIRGVKDGRFEDYEYLLNDQIVYRPSFNYSKIEDLIHDIGLISMKYKKFFDMNLYKRYLDTKTAIYLKENNNPNPCIIGKNTGWSDDLRFFYHYALNDNYHELHPEHVLYKNHKDLIIEKDKQHELVKAILEEGKLLAVLLTASVSALFIKPFKIPGATYIISGTTGAGKTTAALIATSLFYYSDDHLIDAQTSKVGLELTIASLNSLPVLIDEATLAGVNFTLQDLVFMVSSGKGKTRGRKDLTVDFKDLKSNVFWTTETTDVDELRRSGAFRRIIYLVINSWDEFTSLFQANDRINEQYAGCGVDYIQYLLEHMEDIKKAFKDETQTLHTEYKDILTIALNLYAGLILLEAFYNTKFHELRKTIHKLLKEAKARFIDIRDNVTIQVMDLLESVTFQRFHVINKYRKDEDELDIQYARSHETWGEYDKMEGIYYLTPGGLKAIADRLGKNKNLLLDELEKSGALIAKNKSHYFQATKNKGKVHKLKFRDLNDDEQPPETEQTPDLDVPF